MVEKIKGIESIVSSRSIAVVGATNRPGSVGLAVFQIYSTEDIKVFSIQSIQGTSLS